MRRRTDGRYDLALDPALRDVLSQVLADLRDVLDQDPDHPDLERLRPPAYADDADREAAYRLLAGEELRDAQRTSIDAVLASLDRDVLTEDELWSWLRAINGVRLVVGTRLEISDDDHGPDRRGAIAPEEQQLWALYDFTTYIQYEVIQGLSG